MKALTIHQPWASLIAYGHKRYETRSWATSYRGPIAIHAGKSLAPIRELEESDRRLVWRMRTKLYGQALDTLPFGAIVAIGELVACSSTLGGMIVLEENERAFGNFSAGRYAWEIVNVNPLREPIPARGAQGLWDWEPPAARQVSVTMRIEGFTLEVERDDE